MTLWFQFDFIDSDGTPTRGHFRGSGSGAAHRQFRIHRPRVKSYTVSRADLPDAEVERLVRQRGPFASLTPEHPA